MLLLSGFTRQDTSNDGSDKVDDETTMKRDIKAELEMEDLKAKLDEDADFDMKAPEIDNKRMLAMRRGKGKSKLPQAK